MKPMTYNERVVLADSIRGRDPEDLFRMHRRERSFEARDIIIEEIRSQYRRGPSRFATPAQDQSAW